MTSELKLDEGADAVLVKGGMKVAFITAEPFS
jgi:hypothetical protein